MEKRKKFLGISLIVLIITIVVIIILAGAVILGLSNSNVIDRAKITKLITTKDALQDSTNLLCMTKIIQNETIQEILVGKDENTGIMKLQDTKTQYSLENTISCTSIVDGEEKVLYKLDIDKCEKNFKFSVDVERENWYVDLKGKIYLVYETKELIPSNLKGKISDTSVVNTEFSELNKFLIVVGTENITDTSIDLEKDSSYKIEEILEVADTSLFKIKVEYGKAYILGFADGAEVPEKFIFPSKYIDTDGKEYAIYGIKSYNYDGAFMENDIIKKIEIPEGYTELGNYTFKNCKNLESVKLPSTVNKIQNSAFVNCTSLDNINIEYVENFEKLSFYGCKGLSGKLVFSDKTKYIADSAFYGWKNIEEIEIKDTISSIGSYAFRNCTSLKKVTISDKIFSSRTFNDKFAECTSIEEIILTGNSLTSLPNNFLTRKTSVKKVHLTENITKISDYAFDDCTALEEVNIPSSVTYIGINAFRDCSSLKSIALPEGILTLAASAFNGCTSAIGKIKIPSTLSTVSASAFENCSNLEIETILDGVTSIGNKAFYNCKSIGKNGVLEIPSSVNTIGDYAFSKIPGVKEIKFQGPCNYISYNAFALLEEIEKITIDSTSLKYSTQTNNSLMIFSYSKGKIKEINIIGEPFEKVMDNMFSGFIALETLNMPQNYNYIGKSAFYNCSSLKEFVIPSSVTSCGTNPFSNCISLKKLIFKGGQLQIDTLSITLPKGVEVIVE